MVQHGSFQAFYSKVERKNRVSICRVVPPENWTGEALLGVVSLEEQSQRNRKKQLKKTFLECRSKAIELLAII